MVKNRPVLIVDDEPEYLDWISDFLAEVGYESIFVNDLNSALEAEGKRKYSFVLVDMNIPVTATEKTVLSGPEEEKYPGLHVAKYFRTKGYGAHQVIAYTVHDDDMIDAVLARIKCRYVLKARPRILKSVIMQSLGSKPKA